MITFEHSANVLITFALECIVFVEKRADSAAVTVSRGVSPTNVAIYKLKDRTSVKVMYLPGTRKRWYKHKCRFRDKRNVADDPEATYQPCFGVCILENA